MTDMKKSLLLFAALFVFASTGHAQEGMKAIKKAARSLGTYNLNPAENGDKLNDAKDLVLSAFDSDEVKASAKAYQVKGDIMATLAGNTVKTSLLTPDDEALKMADYSTGVQAFEAYKKAFDLAEKKFEKKDALAGLVKLEQIIENIGIVAYQNKNWKGAYDSFQATIGVSDYLAAAGEETIIDATKKEDLIMNSVSVAAQEGSGIDLGPIVEKALGAGMENPTLYQIAYTAFEKTDKEKAVKYLKKGAELFPEDSGLLFAQINYFIGEGKLEMLIDKLKAAIKAEPDNASVSATLGNVYDQLYGKTADEGDEAKAEEYFQGALEYYTKAKEIDPQSFNSYYGIGALYFNKAAKYGKLLNDLGNDFSAAGIKKYDDTKAVMNGFYDQSLPYLQKAEAINPKDGLVLQALREYYVRTGNNDKSAEYKARIDALQAGGN